jgi:xanthine dehydrogenase accessory factor
VKEIHKGLMHCWNEMMCAVLATIVHVDGSSYRREGARCLIFETGEVIGMISGGCVEADLLEHAKEVLTSKIPKKIDYDFRWEDDNLWGMGLGCNGAITVWLEPFDPINEQEQAKKILEELSGRLKCEESYQFISVIDSTQPEKLPAGLYLSTFENQKNFNFLKNQNKPGLVEAKIDGVNVIVFAESIEPLPKLFIIGSGPDAALLAKRANELAWRVIVIDHREQYLTTHFPNVEHRLIKRGSYTSVDIPSNSYVVVMTHNLELDQLALQHLLTINLPYIGVLGSRGRIARLSKMLKDGSDEIDESAFETIHSPVGLDIGAQTPEEITLSILSEMIAYKNGRLGGLLCKVKLDK